MQTLSQRVQAILARGNAPGSAQGAELIEQAMAEIVTDVDDVNSRLTKLEKEIEQAARSIR